MPPLSKHSLNKALMECLSIIILLPKYLPRSLIHDIYTSPNE